MTLTQDAPPTLQGQLTILDGTGDTEVKWDPNVQVEVDAARAQFDLLKGKGYLAYRKDDNQVIRDFDPDAREIVMKQPTAGG